jgi:hypothetical protein
MTGKTVLGLVLRLPTLLKDRVYIRVGVGAIGPTGVTVIVAERAGLRTLIVFNGMDGQAGYGLLLSYLLFLRRFCRFGWF